MKTRIRFVAAAAAALTCVVLCPSVASATAQRTFVSPNGNDGAACSLTAPCRTFAAALALTNSGGEIVVLDSSGYGGVTINKAVSIVVPPGTYAGISVFPGTDGIVINAGATDEVVLRGLTINNQGGNNGVVFNSGAALYIESCTVRGFSGAGMGNVKFAPASGAKLFVKDSFIRGGAAGVLLSNSTTAATATVDNTRIENNAIGISAATFSGSLAVRNSVLTENSSHGINVQTGAGQTLDATVDNVMISNNSGNGMNVVGGDITLTFANSTAVRNSVGLFVQGAATNAVARVTNSAITRNTTGVQTGANGSILTPQSNTIQGNGTDGTVSGNYVSQ